MTKRRICPCRGCDKRHTGCHGGCEDYASWKETENTHKEIAIKEKHKETVLNDFQNCSYLKTARKR